jgi:ferredoxin
MTERYWRLEISHTCVGSGVCVVTAPRHFQLEAGYSQPVRADVVADDDAVVAAAELCPMGAILVSERDTGRSVVVPD